MSTLPLCSRRHPTASETTFTHFSLNIVKKCTDYLYSHELELTGENVHDILIFADYINLTDVTDICSNYIISNIDHSNWARVIEFGYSLGNMRQLIDAGILFFVRNRKELDINNLDDSTVTRITEVLCLQEQRATIMTSEQWDINQVRHFLSVPKDEHMGWQARGSSVYNDNPNCWEPKLAINGKCSRNDYFYFHSQHEMHPWLEVRFPSPVLVSSLTIINRINGCWERLRNLEVRAGMSPVPEGFTANEGGNYGAKQLEVNSRCGYFAGPPAEFVYEGHEIVFDQPTLAQYITFQILEQGFLQINGIKINNGDLLNYDGSFKNLSSS